MTENKKCPISFNSIANILASVSAVGLAGIIGTGTYVYVNRDAIIEDIKKEAIEAVLVWVFLFLADSSGRKRYSNLWNSSCCHRNWYCCRW